MRPKGQVTLVCDRKGRLQINGFFVVDVPGDKPPLLKRKEYADSGSRQYLKIYADETNAVEDEILQTPSFPNSEC